MKGAGSLGEPRRSKDRRRAERAEDRSEAREPSEPGAFEAFLLLSVCESEPGTFEMVLSASPTGPRHR